jgi:hypothetical protein
VSRKGKHRAACREREWEEQAKLWAARGREFYVYALFAMLYGRVVQIEATQHKEKRRAF